MLPRAISIARVLLLLVIAIAIYSCYNAPPPPPPPPVVQQAPPPPEVQENPEGIETPPAPWPVASLAEENITPEATDTPTPSDTPTATDTPYGQTPPPTQTPSPTPTETPLPTLSPEPTPQPDFSQELPAGQLSDRPLDAEIDAAKLPMQKTSIRIADRARRELLKHDPDEALRTLGRALSIDAGNPYVYFYLGRAYLMKHNYTQAMTFWDRAAIGFADDPTWQAEVLSFEGAVNERQGDTDTARDEFARAVKLAPDNQLAKDGLARLGPPPPPPEAEPTAETAPEEAEPPPEEAAPPPAPGEAEPPPAEEPMPGEAATPSEEPPPDPNN
jgi:Tetratricopeptide repeat